MAQNKIQTNQIVPLVTSDITDITSTATELNYLDGYVPTANRVAYGDGTKLTSSANLTFSGSDLYVAGRMGIGIGVDSTRGLNLFTSYTNPSTQVEGARLTISATSSSANAQDHLGFLGIAYTDSGSSVNYTGNLRGAVFFSQHSGTGTLTGQAGGYFESNVTNGGTVTESNGGLFFNYATNSSTITNLRGAQILAPFYASGGSATNAIGLLIGDWSSAGTSSSYAMYSAGGQTYHAGSFGIGTNPSYKLDVNGEINSASGYRVGGTAGASGSFTTADAKTVTVTNGIITSIV